MNRRSFELGKKEWKLAMTSGFGVDAVVADRRRVAICGGWSARCGRGGCGSGCRPQASVVSCYEAGRDGFWIHRALTQLGIRNRVVDSASIEVNRRARRAKTDRLDALKLVQMLVRVCYGERRVWSEVRVPTVAAEAARQVSRERTALTQEQTRLINQMRGLARHVGGRAAAAPPRAAGGPTVRDWAGAPLPVEVQTRLARAEARAGGARGADRGTRGAATGGRDGRGAGECVAAIGAAEGRRDDERVGVARRRLGVARVPQSAPDRRAPGLYADALTTAGSRSGSKGSVGRAISACKRSAFSWRGIGCAGNRTAS